MTKGKIKIQRPTEWDVMKDAEPPTGVLLLVHGLTVDGIIGMPALDVITTGYWSPKLKVMIGADRGECLSEMLELTAYHVLYTPEGKTIPIYDPREPDFDPTLVTNPD